MTLRFQTQNVIILQLEATNKMKTTALYCNAKRSILVHGIKNEIEN